jgi:hypothetical protein
MNRIRAIQASFLGFLKHVCPMIEVKASFEWRCKPSNNVRIELRVENSSTVGDHILEGQIGNDKMKWSG